MNTTQERQGETQGAGRGGEREAAVSVAVAVARDSRMKKIAKECEGRQSFAAKTICGELNQRTNNKQTNSGDRS